jgi:hypothetical protein
MDGLTWEGIPVTFRMTPEQTPQTTVRLSTAVKEAIETVHAKQPNSLMIIPKQGFKIIIWWNYPSIWAALVDIEWVMAHPHKYEEVGLSHQETHLETDIFDRNLYLNLLGDLSTNASQSWPSWLEWRKKRRSKPEWLRSMQAMS